MSKTKNLSHSTCYFSLVTFHLLPIFLLFTFYFLLTTPPEANAQFFGSVQNPLTQVGSGNSYGDVNDPGGGLIGFISNIIKLITIVAGIFSMFNFIIAGVNYIASQGDPKGIEAAQNKMKNSILGLIVIFGTLSLTAMASQVFFGDPAAILRPTIYGPGDF